MKIYAVRILDISEEKMDKLSLLIDSDKRYKIKKFINKKDKIRILIGEILIRTIIVEKLKISNKYIKFNKNQYGKPYLKDYPSFNFNISHSGEYVICAIDNMPVGIDVEKIKHIEYEKIARRFFSTNEIDYIINNDSGNCLGKFYEIWTLRESYIKCCGKGLGISLKSFAIDIDYYGNIKLIINNEYGEYIFKKFDIDEGYKMALCTLNKESSSNIIIIDQSSLINRYLEYSNKFF